MDSISIRQIKDGKIVSKTTEDGDIELFSVHYDRKTIYFSSDRFMDLDRFKQIINSI